MRRRTTPRRALRWCCPEAARAERMRPGGVGAAPRTRGARRAAAHAGGHERRRDQRRYLGGAAHLPADEASAGLLAHWREIDKARPSRPILGHQLPLSLARYAGDPFARRSAVAKSARPRTAQEQPTALDRLAHAPRQRRRRRRSGCHRCHDRSLLRAHGRVRGGRPAGRSGAVANRPLCVDRLGVDHIRASAALPVLFPPVQVKAPAGMPGGTWMEGRG